MMICCPPKRGVFIGPLGVPVVAVPLYLLRLKAHVMEDTVEERRGRLPNHLRLYVTGVLEGAERGEINALTHWAMID